MQELSSLSVEPCEGESILVTVFEVSVNEVSKPRHRFTTTTELKKTI